MKQTEGWHTRLVALLSASGVEGGAGAEIEVTDPGGEVVLLAPLARHHRLDENGTLWLRPIVGGYLPDPAAGVPAYAFSLEAARPRAFAPGSVRAEGEGLVALLVSGQMARIRPASPAVLGELVRWDTFCATVLTVEEETDLDAVWGDSYLGPWA